MLPNGKLTFTLIDFGVSSKLRRRKSRENACFKGNYIYSSFSHLDKGFANELDDLYSLVFLAYKMVYRVLPWEIIEEVKNDPSFANSDEFADLRIRRAEEFMQILLDENSAFLPLF